MGGNQKNIRSKFIKFFQILSKFIKIYQNLSKKICLVFFLSLFFSFWKFEEMMSMSPYFLEDSKKNRMLLCLSNPCLEEIRAKLQEDARFFMKHGDKQVEILDLASIQYLISQPGNSEVVNNVTIPILQFVTVVPMNVPDGFEKVGKYAKCQNCEEIFPPRFQNLCRHLESCLLVCPFFLSFYYH